MKVVKWNAPPSLAVIDEAIEFIRSGYTVYTCIALQRAVERCERTAHPSGRDWLYRSQYRRCVWGPNSHRPVWWDCRFAYYKNERIAALQAFRQACIDAGAKQ